MKTTTLSYKNISTYPDSHSQTKKKSMWKIPLSIFTFMDFHIQFYASLPNFWITIHVVAVKAEVVPLQNINVLSLKTQGTQP